MNSSRIPFVWGLLLATLIAGCGATQTYTGPRLPPEQVAYIRSHTSKMKPSYQLDIHVVAVDGQRPSGAKLDFEVLPGEHTLAVGVKWSTHLLAAPLVAMKGLKLADSHITFRAESGRTFRLNGEEGPDKRFYGWLEDEASGAVVGGRKPGVSGGSE